MLGELCVCIQAAGQELSLTENRQGLNPRLGASSSGMGETSPPQTVLANKLSLPSANVQNGDARTSALGKEVRCGKKCVTAIFRLLKAYLLGQLGSF